MSDAATATPPAPTKKAAPPAKPRMPPVEVGMPVEWYPGGDRKNAHVAFVTQIGYDSLNLNVLLPQSYNMSIKDGVRHVDDDRAKSNEVAEAGTWDFSPWFKKVLALIIDQ